MDRFFSTVQRSTESFLTWRARRQQVKRARQHAKNPIVDWIEAFLWAAGVVLLINQYLLQAYQIPSSSMHDTLQVNDRIFVNKLVYGPELLPGIAKLPGFETPERGEVIIFENPAYIGKGPAFDVLQRVLYMLTLSLVDIDRDEFGSPRPHFLIKRAVGVAGDRLRTRRGFMEIRPEGELEWYSETEFVKLAGLEYPVNRLIPQTAYPGIEALGAAEAYRTARLPIPEALQSAASSAPQSSYHDAFAGESARQDTLHAIAPHDARTRLQRMRLSLGWYVPDGRIMPLGDNRDNSNDGRFFGAVRLEKVLGRAMIKYWPLDRFGRIR